MALQQSISLARNQAQVGRTLDVLVESQGQLDHASASIAASPALRGGAPVTFARSYRDAPEVDGFVVIPGQSLALGQVATVHVTGALAYDLIGELAPETHAAGVNFTPAAELKLFS
jgi:ribosomal protein S12 methylthiotransferase